MRGKIRSPEIGRIVHLYLLRPFGDFWPLKPHLAVYDLISDRFESGFKRVWER